MRQVQNLKYVAITPPAAIVNNASLTTNVIDRAGYDNLTILVHLGATDIAMTALKVQESDAQANATTLTGGVDVPRTVFGTAKNTTGAVSNLPTALDDNNFIAIHLDLKGRKRFIKPVVTIGNGAAGAFVTVIGILTGGHVIPYSAAERGLSQEINAN